jgi:hypothetical protein
MEKVRILGYLAKIESSVKVLNRRLLSLNGAVGFIS